MRDSPEVGVVSRSAGPRKSAAKLRGPIQTMRWIEDPGQSGSAFSPRTLFRHKGLPELRQRWPAAPDNLLQLAEGMLKRNHIWMSAHRDLGVWRASLFLHPWLSAWAEPGCCPCCSPCPFPGRTICLRYWLHLHNDPCAAAPVGRPFVQTTVGRRESVSRNAALRATA